MESAFLFECMYLGMYLATGRKDCCMLLHVRKGEVGGLHKLVCPLTMVIMPAQTQLQTQFWTFHKG